MLPFIDLLDFLLKKAISMTLIKKSFDPSAVQPSQNYSEIFKNASFDLFCSFRTIEDFVGWEWISKLHSISAG